METKIYKAYFGRKFLIPAELDILISFHPVRNKEGSSNQYTTSESGGYRFRVKHQYEITQE